MHIPTPGFEPSEPESTLHAAGAVVGVVLALRPPGDTGERWFRGYRCDVLLLETLSIARDVLLTTRDGSHPILPRVTSPEIVALLASGAPIPSPSQPNAQWGDYVLLSRLENGMPFVSHFLPHPAAHAASLPPLVGPEYATDDAMGARVASQMTPATDTSALPAELTSPAAVARPPVPPPFSRDRRQRAAWLETYIAAHMIGAEQAWTAGQATPPAEARFDTPAQAAGWEAGWGPGQRRALALRAESPPEVTPAAQPPADPAALPDPPTAADEDGDEAVKAVPTGPDVVYEAFGVRVLIRKDGAFLVDSRAAGVVRVQGSGSGVKITASGAVVEVGAGGKEVNVTADAVRLRGSGGAALNGVVRGEDLETFLKTTFQVSTAFGPSGPMIVDLPAAVLSEGVKVR